MTKMILGFHSIYTEGLHPEVRFPRQRYTVLEKELKLRGAEQLINFFTPGPATTTQLQLAHDNSYIDRFLNGQLNKMERRRIGLRPWTDAIVERTRILTGGTLAATDFAIQNTGYGANMAGGTHHAYYDHGSGYCIVNDIAIAAHHAHNKYGKTKIAVVDLDVHQGDGTASIFSETDWVFTLSIHGEKNFPFKKQRSSFDIALANKTSDDDYLKAVERGLHAVVDYKPDLVFYQGGVDPLNKDKLGKLDITPEGLQERNKLVFNTIDSIAVPAVVLMGGGYADPIQPSISALADLFMEAANRHKGRQERRKSPHLLK